MSHIVACAARAVPRRATSRAVHLEKAYVATCDVQCDMRRVIAMHLGLHRREVAVVVIVECM